MLKNIKAKIRNLKNKFLESKFLVFTLGLVIGASYMYIYIVAPQFKSCVKTIEINHDEVITAEAPVKQPEPTHNGVFSAYTASAKETDSNPTIMANSHHVHAGAIANNCLPFGTKVKVNNKTYTIEDRMNSRYGCDNFDIYMQSYQDAIQWGRKKLTYTIVK